MRAFSGSIFGCAGLLAACPWPGQEQTEVPLATETEKTPAAGQAVGPEPAPDPGDGLPIREPGAPITDAEEPPQQLQLAMEGPVRDLAELCRQLELRVRDSIGGAPVDLGFRCRTDLQVPGQPIAGLSSDELGEPWVAVRFLETSHDYAGFVGELRLALYTEKGVYVSASFLPLAEDGYKRKFIALDFEALPLAAGSGNELYARVVLERGREYSRGVEDFGSFVEDEITVVCTLRETGPYCLAAQTAWRSLEVAFDGVGSGRLRMITSEEGTKGSMSFPQNGIVELSFPDDAPPHRRNLAGRYSW